MNKLCECGCGQPVLHQSARFCLGHHRRVKEFKDKFTKTMINRYGHEHALQNQYSKEKLKNTSLDRWGTVHPMKSRLVRQKFEQSMLDQYGFKNALQIEKFRNKGKI